MTEDFAGFVRIAAAVPRVRVADFKFNREETLALWQRAHDEGCAVVYFPELGLSAYTAGDLHMDHHLLRSVRESLADLLAAGRQRGLRPLAFVGMPLFVHPGIYNVAVAIQGGRILGVVPKSYLPNYREFYEQRQFREGRELDEGTEIELCGQRVPFGTDILFVAENQPDVLVGVEVCEDGWVHLSPNAFQSSAGAIICGNLSASNFTIGKGELRHRLCWKASDPGKCAYVYTAAGPGESSADLAFDAHALIYEDGRCLAESKRFARESQLITADVDIELLLHERFSTGSFAACASEHLYDFRHVEFTAHAPAVPGPLRRSIDRHPFVPKDPATLATRCWEVFEIQTNSLMTRLQSIGSNELVLGLSGGRDSTVAALACVSALDQLGASRTSLHCVSMPGFGTSEHTRTASRELAEALGASFEEEDIREEALLVMRAQGHPAAVGYDEWLAREGREHSQETLGGYLAAHPEFGDVEFENVQARIRTLRLMTKANRHRGVVIGTGDLSEKALGWATYSGDHIAMYDLNAGIPKTLIDFIIRWVANEQTSQWTAGDPARLREILFDILAAPISPELVPLGAEGKIAQLSESKIGPYELHDFFLYWLIRHGTRPRRILRLAEAAFVGAYTTDEIAKWLTIFYQRFFSNQWKRDCTADGSKVGTVALSPRGDWRMPSDAVVTAWIEDIRTAVGTSTTGSQSTNGRAGRPSRVRRP
ncbi:MAG TPA: NAD(+) synthase [Dehalococcoidia bacterium]|nr:NAD(+) synthase [Dehalococcoidia bacterium]